MEILIEEKTMQLIISEYARLERLVFVYQQEFDELIRNLDVELCSGSDFLTASGRIDQQLGEIGEGLFQIRQFMETVISSFMETDAAVLQEVNSLTSMRLLLISGNGMGISDSRILYSDEDDYIPARNDKNNYACVSELPDLKINDRRYNSIATGSIFGIKI